MITCVITSIYPPSDGVRAFARNPLIDNLVVVGDRKTPSDWQCDGVDYWGMDRQFDEFGRLARLLPENHYCRKNLGYLVAMRASAQIYDTDDDNLPYDHWAPPGGASAFALATGGQGFVNTYRHFTDDFIWPRGYPLAALRKPMQIEPGADDVANVPIWQGLADDDPDVDAVYRMVIGKTGIKFRDSDPLVLAPGTYCPFNSQNTFFSSEAFALLYLPVTTTMRYTDILRSYVAQAVAQSLGWKIGFHRATVYQERNVHDQMTDFEDEVPMYLTSVPVMDALVDRCADHTGTIAQRLLDCYETLVDEGVVTSAEIEVLTEWLDVAVGSATATSGAAG